MQYTADTQNTKMNLINIAAIAIFSSLCLTEVYCNPDYTNYYEGKLFFIFLLGCVITSVILQVCLMHQF